MFRNVKIVLVLIICLICQACDASGGASRPAAKAAPVMLWYATLMDGVFEVNEDHELYLYRLPDALTLELNFAPMMQAADGSLSAYAAGNASFKPQYQLCYGAAICEPKGEWLSAADEQTMVVQADWPELKTFFIMLRFRDASSGTPLMSLAWDGVNLPLNGDAGLVSSFYYAVTRGPQFLPTPSATPLPLSLTQTVLAAASPVQGSIQVAPGSSIIGGEAGSSLIVMLAFSASSKLGTVTEMRLGQNDWEPFVPEKQVEITIPLNWSTLRYCVIFKDEKGNLSPEYCDGKGVEGHPPVP